MPIKTLGSLGKIRVGRVTGNTHFFLALLERLVDVNTLDITFSISQYHEESDCHVPKNDVNGIAN